MENEELELNAQQECPQYPESQPNELPVAPVQTVADKVLPALKDSLFLVICILMSVSCLIALSLDSVPLISILITVFLWLTYAQARKGIADAKHLRCVSGTVYAQYVITYVLAVLLVVVGVIFAIAFSSFTGDPEYLYTLLSGFSDLGHEEMMFLLRYASVASFVFVIIFAIVAILIMLANVFIIRYIHRFAKSVYQSIETNTPEFKHIKAAKVCLFIVSGCYAVNTLSSLGTFLPTLSNAVACATTLIAGLLIQKYFQVKE